MRDMEAAEFGLKASDGTSLHVHAFTPPQTARAVVQISHGMGEHSARYGRLAQALCEAGFAVYASDHRGHGKTAQRSDELGYFADERGFRTVVYDQITLLEEAQARHPGAPLFLFGHSMGSYVARGVAFRRGAALAGLVLSGTSHDHPLAYVPPRLIIAAERARLGKRGTSALIRKLTFDAFNKRIPSPRTSFDWLSRDASEVDKYIADPLCGFECSTQLWHDLLGGLIQICTPRNIALMPKTLPVLVLAGQHDPVNSGLVGIKKLQTAFEQAGMQALTVRVYPGARHELVNETNRAEVTADLIAWLERQLN
jgi:alpha-beta hydrolase superfamily lysophospholipase